MAIPLYQIQINLFMKILYDFVVIRIYNSFLEI